MNATDRAASIGMGLGLSLAHRDDVRPAGTISEDIQNAVQNAMQGIAQTVTQQLQASFGPTVREALMSPQFGNAVGTAIMTQAALPQNQAAVRVIGDAAGARIVGGAGRILAAFAIGAAAGGGVVFLVARRRAQDPHAR